MHVAKPANCTFDIHVLPFFFRVSSATPDFSSFTLSLCSTATFSRRRSNDSCLAQSFTGQDAGPAFDVANGAPDWGEDPVSEGKHNPAVVLWL